MREYLERIESKLDFLIKKQTKMEMTIDQVLDDMAAVQGTVSGLKTEIAGLKDSEVKQQAAIAAALATLKGVLGTGGNATTAQLQALHDGLTAVVTDVTGASADVDAVKATVDGTPLDTTSDAPLAPAPASTE